MGHDWFAADSVMIPADSELYRRLRWQWSSDPGKDEGEAASLVLAKRHGWWMLCDDGTAFATAIAEGICCTRTTAFLVAFVRLGRMSAATAWAAYEQMLTAGRRLGTPPWTDKVDFERLCAVTGFDPCMPSGPEPDDTAALFEGEAEIPYGVGRAGDNIRENFDRALKDAMWQKSISIEFETPSTRVISLPDAAVTRFRIPGDDVQRSIEEIPKVEIAAAALHLVEDQFGMQRDAIPARIANIFGFSRARAPSADQIREVIDELIEQGRLRPQGPNLYLA